MTAFLIQLLAAAGVFALIEWADERLRARLPGRSDLRYGVWKLCYGLPAVLALFAVLLLGTGMAPRWTAIVAGVLFAALLALIFFGDDE